MDATNKLFRILGRSNKTQGMRVSFSWKRPIEKVPSSPIKELFSLMGPTFFFSFPRPLDAIHPLFSYTAHSFSVRRINVFASLRLSSYFNFKKYIILGEGIKKKMEIRDSIVIFENMRKSVLVALISRIACRCRNALKYLTFFKHVIFNFVKCKFWIYYIEIQNRLVVIQPDVGFDGKKIPNPHSPD